MLTKKAFEFLIENRLNNNRQWYLDHKNDYETYVLQPLKDLVVELTPAISEMDEHIVTIPKVDKTISRVYRDTRFSKEKTLYREEVWLSFRRDKKVYPNYPEFFFAAQPDGFLYGCGYFAATPEAMERMRKLILANDPLFVKARKAYEKQSELIMDGDLYKRSKYPEQSEPLRNWLDRKNICFMCNSRDFSLLFSDKLSEKLIYTFKQMEPVYNFLIKAETMK